MPKVMLLNVIKSYQLLLNAAGVKKRGQKKYMHSEKNNDSRL